jgi:hypothetical protein
MKKISQGWPGEERKVFFFIQSEIVGSGGGMKGERKPFGVFEGFYLKVYV